MVKSKKYHLSSDVTLAIMLVCLGLITTGFNYSSGWLSKKKNGYTIHYKPSDSINIKEYSKYFETGADVVVNFFNLPFKTDYSVYIHPSRQSIDSTWQKDWKIPDFYSECWMVASGVSHQLDIISPKHWDSLSCEHKYSDSIKTQRLISHELIHVYHGQYNVSHDFSNISGMDWFIEGLAVYASGQCDNERILAVKDLISKGLHPSKLANFWSGPSKYGLSGTMVMYIDHKYGRQTLVNLLGYNDIKDLMKTLKISEPQLVSEWANFILNL